MLAIQFFIQDSLFLYLIVFPVLVFNFETSNREAFFGTLLKLGNQNTIRLKLYHLTAAQV